MKSNGLLSLIIFRSSFLPRGVENDASVAGRTIWEGGFPKKMVANYPGIEVASRITEEAYILEIKIPDKVLKGYTPSVGKEIGFDLKLNEPDDRSIDSIFWGGGDNTQA